jgi:hypothetical protein
VSGHGGAPEEHAIHLPQPSISPPIIGLGVMILSFGVLFGVPLLLIGGAIMVVGIATWLIDDARASLRAGASSGEGHH